MSTDLQNILFVDDEISVLKGLQRLLRRYRSGWNMTFVDSGKAALQHLENHPCDVVITDIRMPGMDGTQLLAKISKQYPHIVRTVLSGQACREAVLRVVEPSHQYLSKPCVPERLENTVRRACQLREMLSNNSMKTLVTQITSLPSRPATFQELQAALRNPDTPVTVVAQIIAKDIAMTAKLLKLVNSAYFGVAQQVTCSQQAVSMLGIDIVRTLFLSVGVFSPFEQKQLDHFPLDEFEQHCHRVANVAKSIAASVTGNRQLAETAYTAALLHDIGKLVLVSNRNDEYQDVKRRAKVTKSSLIELEVEQFGASHQTIGAYLLGIWGLPDDLVEAVEFHHVPSQSKTTRFTPLTAVHAANVIDLSRSQPKARVEWDHEYIDALGLTEQLPVWQDIASEIYRKTEPCSAACY